MFLSAGHGDLHGGNVLVGRNPHVADLAGRLTRELDEYWETAAVDSARWEPNKSTSIATYFISHALGAYGFSPSGRGSTRIDLAKHLELVDPTPTPRFIDTPAVLYELVLDCLSQVERELADPVFAAGLLRRIEARRTANPTPHPQLFRREHARWYLDALWSRSDPPDWAAVRQVLEKVAETLVAHALGLVRRARIPRAVATASTLIDRLDHSIDSHRSRAPGRTRDLFMSVVRRGLALG